MKTTRTNALTLLACAALWGVAMSPVTASAQSELDVAQAQAFLGKWVINMDTDYGPLSLNLELTNMSGKVGATIGSDEMGMADVTDIARQDASLVLNYMAEAQGQMFDVQITLEPDGDNLSVFFSAAGGQFSANGTATKAAS